MSKYLCRLLLIVYACFYISIISSSLPKYSREDAVLIKAKKCEVCLVCQNAEEPVYPHELGMTSAMHAVISDRLDLVDVCLERGDNLEAQDGGGWTALSYAIDSEFVVSEENEAVQELRFFVRNKIFYELLQRGSDYNKGRYLSLLYGLDDKIHVQVKDLVGNRLYWVCKGLISKGVPRSVIEFYILPLLYHSSWITNSLIVDEDCYFKNRKYTEGGVPFMRRRNGKRVRVSA